MRRRTESSPFARAFFVLLEGLDILPAQSASAAVADGRETRVRVVTPLGSAAAGAG